MSLNGGVIDHRGIARSQYVPLSTACCLTALDLVKRVNSEFLRLQVDLFHLQNIAGNITNNLKELLPYTGEPRTQPYTL